MSLKWMFCHQNWTSYTPKIAISTFIRKLEREQLLCIYTMIRNPYLWNVFRLILSLKSSKTADFFTKTPYFDLTIPIRFCHFSFVISNKMISFAVVK